MKSAHPVGLVGVGLVGTALAGRLVTAGTPCVAYDVDRSRTRALAELGVRDAAGIEAVCADCETIVLSLPDSSAVRLVAEQILAASEQPRTIIDTTTGDPDNVEQIAGILAAEGIDYLDATISGSSEQVASGEAVFMVGADDDAYNAALPLLQILSPTVVHAGPVGSGSRAKLASNLVLGLNRLALAEGLVFAEKLGLDPARFLDLLVQTPAYSRQMDTKGPKMVEGDFEPAARLRQHRKDVRLILEAARRAGLDLPVSGLHEQLLQAAIDAGDGDLDNSAIIRQLRRK